MISVLYVDDERDLCELGKLFLEQTGEFLVDTCTSAKEALASDRFSGYDAIISDYLMPEMDGIVFLQAVRAQYGDLPFILFTGRGREDVVIAAINHGADFYLQKGGEPTAQFAELAHKIRIAVERRQAKDALSESEQRLNDIINFLPDATFVIDRSGTVIAWNRAIEEMTGVPAAAILGKGDHEYAIPFYGARRKILIDLIFESDEIIATHYAHIVHDKDLLIAETTLPRPKGEPKILMGTASPLYNRQGEIVGAIEAIRDITSFRKAEEDAIHTRKDWETIFRAIGHPVIILDAENHILDANDATVRASGMSLEQLKQKHCYEVFHGTETDRPPVSCPFELLRSTGSTGPTEAEIEALGGFYHITCTPVFDAGGRLEKVIHIAMDITERHRAQDEIKAAYDQIAASEEQLRGQYDALVESEQNLRESEAKYRELADLLPQVVYEMDPRLRITYANRHALAVFGVTGHDIESGMNALKFISPSDHGRIRQNMEKLVRGEPFDDHEYTATRRDGTTFPVLIYSAPKFRSGTLAGFCGVVIDITEHRKLEVEIKEQQQQLNNFMQNLPVGVFRTTPGPSGIGIMANPLIARICGYDSAEEFMEGPVADRYADPVERKSLTDRIIREGRVENAEIRLRKKNGDLFWASISAIAVRGPDGNVAYFDGVLMDITGRKQQEKSLKIQLDLGLALQEIHGLKETMDACISAAIEISDMDAGGIYLVDEKSGSVDLVISRNLTEEFVARISHYPPDSPNARIVMAGKPIYDVYSRTGIAKTEIHEREGLQAIAIIPIMFNGRVIACLNIASHTHDDIPHTTRILLETIATQIGAAIERIRSEDVLRCRLDQLTAARDELRKRREQLEEIANTVPGVVFQFYARPDGAKGVSFTSNRAFEVFGMEENLSDPLAWFIDHIDSRDRPGFLESMQTAVSAAEPWHFEGRFVHPSGKLIWFEGISRPVPRNDELIYNGVLLDITERREAGEHLRESEERYRIFVETANEGIWAIDADFITTFTNRKILEIFGYGADEMLGRPVWDFVVPEEVDEMKQSLLERRTGIPGRYERRWIRKDGSIVWCLTSATPLFSPEGTFVGSFGMFTDITERKRMEAEVREQHRQLDNVMQNLPAGVFRTTVGSPAKRIMANPILAQTFGYDSVEDYMASSLEDSYTDPDARQAIVDRLVREGMVSNVEVRMKKKNGDPVWICMSAVAVTGPDGSPEYIDGILTEITARKKAEEALNEANRKLKLLNSITRHDIRNQLTGLKGLVEVASAKATDPDLGNYLVKIQNIAETITRQIEFTRAYQELGINVPAWLRLDDVIKKTTTPVLVTYTDSCGGVEIFADPMLEQVFFNLFENAVRHGKKVTEISIRCEPQQDNIRIVVEDNGIGIRAGDKEKIFGRGFGKNTGLGLFLAKEILSITGIGIRETGTEGDGARFEMVVPKGAFRRS